MKIFVITLIIVNFCSVGLSLAQTGPGGVGNFTSNVLWLEASTSVYSNAGTTLAANNDNVQQWNDRSGNGRHATEATVGNRPNYTTNSLNGLPTLRFASATTDRLTSTTVTT